MTPLSTMSFILMPFTLMVPTANVFLLFHSPSVSTVCWYYILLPKGVISLWKWFMTGLGRWLCMLYTDICFRFHLFSLFSISISFFSICTCSLLFYAGIEWWMYCSNSSRVTIKQTSSWLIRFELSSFGCSNFFP